MEGRYLLEESPEDPWLSSAYAVVKYVLEHSDRFVVPELCRDVRDTLEEDASRWIDGESSRCPEGYGLRYRR